MLTVDKWNHITVVLTGNDKNVKIYFNGKLAKKATHNINSWEPGAGDKNIPLSIGTLYPYGCGWGGNSNFSFQGWLDQVHIYEQALSSAQIQKLYAKEIKKHKLAEKTKTGLFRNQGSLFLKIIRL
jgi:hypothetical protein